MLRDTANVNLKNNLLFRFDSNCCCHFFHRFAMKKRTRDRIWEIRGQGDRNDNIQGMFESGQVGRYS